MPPSLIKWNSVLTDSTDMGVLFKKHFTLKDLFMAGVCPVFLSKTLEITIYFAITFFDLIDFTYLIILEKVDSAENLMLQFF